MIAQRVLAVLAHVALVLGLLGIGWRLFERPITGMAMAACYLVLPYTRMALVDSGQLISAALIIAAVFWYTRPAVAGVLIGLAAGWIPACLGLIALWCGFYRGRGALRFTLVAAGVVTACALVGHWVPALAKWARALGARSIVEVGLFPHFEPGTAGSFWASIDSSFRLPVLIAYLLLVIGTMLWPAEKNLAELIATVGGAAGRQPVLVPGQGGRPGDALPAPGDRDDVPADARRPPPGRAGAPPTRQERVALSLVLTVTAPAEPRLHAGPPEGSPSLERQTVECRTQCQPQPSATNRMYRTGPSLPIRDRP